MRMIYFISIANDLFDPLLTVNVTNSSVKELRNIQFVAIVSDPAGNAFAASQTALPILLPGERQEIVFTWPVPFNITVGRIIVLPLSAPAPFSR